MSEDSKPVLYMNIVRRKAQKVNDFKVLDASEVIRARVKKKVEGSKLPKQMKDVVAKRAGNVASVRVKRSIIAKEMSSKLCRTMPEKMKRGGVTVVLDEVFREEHYFVLELQVKHVDAVAIERKQRDVCSESTKDDQDTSTSFAGTLLDWTLKIMGQDNQRRLEGEFLPSRVQQKLETQMMEIMAEKFENMQLKAEVEIMKEEKQARYFYSRLKTVRQEAELGKGKNPIRGLRKKMSGDQEDLISTTKSY